MVLRYGGRNFFSFKEGFDVNLRLNKKCPKNISKGRDVCSLMGIKGANSSGKTSTLRALTFIIEFMRKSFSEYEPDEPMGFSSYFGNDEVTYLFLEFRSGKQDYLYELELNDEKVFSESLFYLDEKGNTIGDYIFLREESKFKFSNDFDDSEMIPKVRDNVSLISTSHQFSVDTIYDLIPTVMSNVSYTGFNRELFKLEAISELYHKHSILLDFTTKMLKKFDTGIVDIEIHFRDKENGKKQYYPVFYYDKKHTKMNSFAVESSGTKRLFTHLSAFCTVLLSSNSLLIMDELDLHLHPSILPELINLFENEESNQKNAQLIFNCHNNEIMDKLGKYRITLVDKVNTESCTRRLDEVSGELLRNNRPIRKHYENGILGGVPEIGR